MKKITLLVLFTNIFFLSYAQPAKEPLLSQKKVIAPTPSHSTNSITSPLLSPHSTIAPGFVSPDSVKSKNSSIATPIAGSTNTENWEQYMLSIIVLVFGMLIILILLLLLLFSNLGFTSDNAIKIISITLIITGLLFIVSLGTTQASENVKILYAPAFGLLGTIAGYILAKISSPSTGSTPSKGNNSSTPI